MEGIFVHVFNALLLMMNMTITAVGLALYSQGYRYTTEGKTIIRAIICFQAAYIWLMATLLLMEIEALQTPADWRTLMLGVAYLFANIACSYFLYATIKRNPVVKIT
jgi:hypothetical protein